MTSPMPALLIPDDTSEGLAASALALARRFAAGATIWCLSASWPSHGRHVAVEFVHPVIVGKRALPAICVDPPKAADTLRLLTRPGDVLLVVAPGGDVATRALLRRAEAWGLYRMWLGAGPRPSSGLVEQLAWLEAVDPSVAARNGDIVMLYHLLWELTHVVFEHPGLLNELDSLACDDHSCITCSDQGRLAEVQRLIEPGVAEVLLGGHLEHVEVTTLEVVGPTDLLLVHAGVALDVVDPTRY